MLLEYKIGLEFLISHNFPVFNLQAPEITSTDGKFGFDLLRFGLSFYFQSDNVIYISYFSILSTETTTTDCTLGFNIRLDLI